jgi:hypothetical protein
MRRGFLVLLGAVCLCAGAGTLVAFPVTAGAQIPPLGDSATPTPSPTPSAKATAAPKATGCPSPSATATPSPTPASTAAATPTPVPTPTPTPCPSAEAVAAVTTPVPTATVLAAVETPGLAGAHALPVNGGSSAVVAGEAVLLIGIGLFLLALARSLRPN